MLLRLAMVPPHPDARVVILGGGLAGISAAYHLKRPWLLLEKEARLGGHARTDQTNGFRNGSFRRTHKTPGVTSTT